MPTTRVRKATASPSSPTKQVQPPDPSDHMALDELKAIIEGLESIETAAQGFASFEAGAVSMTVEGMTVSAIWDGRRWWVKISEH